MADLLQYSACFSCSFLSALGFASSTTGLGFSSSADVGGRVLVCLFIKCCAGLDSIPWVGVFLWSRIAKNGSFPALALALRSGRLTVFMWTLLSRLPIVGTYGCVFELVCRCEVDEFFNFLLWSVVSDNLIWDSISCKMCLQLRNDCCCFYVFWKLVNLPKVAVIDYCCQVLFTTQLK